MVQPHDCHPETILMTSCSSGSSATIVRSNCTSSIPTLTSQNRRRWIQQQQPHHHHRHRHHPYRPSMGEQQGQHHSLPQRRNLGGDDKYECQQPKQLPKQTDRNEGTATTITPTSNHLIPDWTQVFASLQHQFSFEAIYSNGNTESERCDDDDGDVDVDDDSDHDDDNNSDHDHDHDDHASYDSPYDHDVDNIMDDNDDDNDDDHHHEYDHPSLTIPTSSHLFLSDPFQERIHVLEKEKKHFKERCRVLEEAVITAQNENGIIKMNTIIAMSNVKLTMDSMEADKHCLAEKCRLLEARIVELQSETARQQNQIQVMEERERKIKKALTVWSSAKPDPTE